MTVEVLLSMMFLRKPFENFLDGINLETDIVICNQCDSNGDEKFLYKGNKVTVLSRNERGVGRSRNICLACSTADIVLFADNDVKYYDEYKKKIEKYYKEHPRADLVIFNFKEKRGEEPIHDINKKNKRAHFKDIMKFGAWAITAKRESILKKRISFSLLFGGGSKYSMGEDTLFLTDCYRNGLKIYLSDITLGEVVHKESTWFDGITVKYIHDKGALFKAISPRLYRFLIMYHVFKHSKDYLPIGKIKKILNIMHIGVKDYERNRDF